MSNMTPFSIQKEMATGAWKPNIYLSNMAMAFFQEMSYFVADQVFPVIPVQLPSASYITFSKEDLMRDDVRKKPLYGSVDPAAIGNQSNTYNCEIDQLILGNDEFQAITFQRSGIPGASDPRTGRVRTAVEKSKIHNDRIWAEKFFKPGVWVKDMEGTADAPGSDQFYQFDNGNSDPVRFVGNQIVEMKKESSVKPNKIVLGAEVFVALQNHEAILERIKYQGSAANPASVTEKILAELFGVDKVVTAWASYNKKPVGGSDIDFIVDPKGMLLTYAPDHAAIDVPSAGYTFAWDILGAGTHMALTQFKGPQATHTEYLEGIAAYDMKQTCKDLGFYFGKCVGSAE